MKSSWKSDCTSLLFLLAQRWWLQLALNTVPISPLQPSPLSYCSPSAWKTTVHDAQCCHVVSVCYLVVVSRNNFEVRWYSWPRSSFSKAFFLSLNASNFTLPEPQLLLCKIWHFKLLMNPSWRWNSGLCIEDIECRRIFLPVNPSTRILHQPRDRTEI